MALTAHAAAVDGQHGPLLLPTSLHAESGEVTLVAGDPGPGLTTLALALGGRVRLTGGEVRCNGDAEPHIRRARVCLVDVPEVTEPDPALPVEVVLGEELALAGLPSGRRDVRAYLTEHDAEGKEGMRWEALDASDHVAWLADIASQRQGVTAAVITSPDRWGGDPHSWMRVAGDLAARGLIVVVLATHNSLRLLGADSHYEVGVVA